MGESLLQFPFLLRNLEEWFPPPPTTSFLTKCYRNICCSDIRNVKAINVSTVKAFSWACRVLAFLLNLFISSAQEISEKGREAEEGRCCSSRGHRGEAKIKKRFGSFFSASNSSCMILSSPPSPLRHLLFTQFVSHPQWQNNPSHEKTD